MQDAKTDGAGPQRADGLHMWRKASRHQWLAGSVPRSQLAALPAWMTEASAGPRPAASHAFAQRHALTQPVQLPQASATGPPPPSGPGYPRMPDLDLLTVTGDPQRTLTLPPQVRRCMPLPECTRSLRQQRGNMLGLPVTGLCKRRVSAERRACAGDGSDEPGHHRGARHSTRRDVRPQPPAAQRGRRRRGLRRGRGARERRDAANVHLHQAHA